MKQRATFYKKHSIFRKFLIPLIAIMLMQSVLTLGTLVYKRTGGMIEDYSVSMLTRTVENRKVILENEMNLRWASVYEQEQGINAQLERFLYRQRADVEELIHDQGMKNALLKELFPECLEVIQNNLTTGIFVVLAGDKNGGEGEYDGFFIRDSEPQSFTANYSDLLLERGNKELSRTYGIPLDTCWTTSFHIAGPGERDCDSFFHEPFRAGSENPEADTAVLGYWSAPFVLEDDVNDSHRMITYSIPLRYEGKTYGVLGIEIAVSYLFDNLPLSELSDRKQSAYVLALNRGDGRFTALAGKGVLYGNVASDGQTFVLGEAGYDSFYRAEGARLGSQKIYGVVCPLKLHDRNVPYEDTDWVLLGLNAEEELFGMSRRLYLWIGIAIFVGLLFGVVGIYFIVFHLTKPIQNLMRCIDEGSAGLKNFQRSNILEIDSLYEVVEKLTRKQKESENILLEEKERYRVALESTDDAFFSYDFGERKLDIVNHPTMSGEWPCEELNFIDSAYIYFEDRKLVDEAFRNISDGVFLEFRMRFSGEDFIWVELSGNVVCDADGNRYKLVGTIRNIQSRKEQEAQRQARLSTDGVTGLYAYTAGMDRVERCRGEQPRGIMLQFMLENLNELNETNGIVFGDMILEEMGRGLRSLCAKREEQSGHRVIAMRFDGDEVSIWLENGTREEAVRFAGELFDIGEGMFDRETLELELRAGLTEAEGGDSGQELVKRAKYALGQIQGSAARYLFFEDIPSGGEIDLPPLQGSEIISNDYGQELNLASLALNLFGKGANLQAQMTLILRKTGHHYGASDVLTTVFRPDFSSNYLEYQWHSQAAPIRENVSQYTGEEWKAFQNWLGRAQVHSFEPEDSLRPELQKFLNISQGQRGIVLPMYDSGSYMGNICILSVSPEILENGEERQKLEELGNVVQSQLNQQQHDLASKAKSDFLSRMSHEIRTPMNGIIGMTVIALQENQSRDRMLDCLNKIKDSSQYLLGLINDILDMSKIESGKMNLELQDFDLPELLETVRHLVLPQMETKKIEFVQETELKHRWFFADKLRISQVLLNLLGNAAKFTPEGGKVVLTARETEGEDSRPAVYFAVRDNGVGISREDQKRVFRAFEQATGADAVSKLQGTGLGLSISSRLIEMMGSSIRLESEPGRGSCFSFCIPLEPGKGVEETEAESVSFRGRRVLVVEDNELNAEIAQCLLEESGFSVEIVNNGAKAVDKIKSAEPDTYDVILMDIMMPVMNGLDAARAIRAMDREDCRRIPIVAMSANAFDDDLKKSVECGMNGHLSKPVEVEKLYRTLREVLDSRGRA